MQPTANKVLARSGFLIDMISFISLAQDRRVKEHSKLRRPRLEMLTVVTAFPLSLSDLRS